MIPLQKRDMRPNEAHLEGHGGRSGTPRKRGMLVSMILPRPKRRDVNKLSGFMIALFAEL